MTVNEDSLGFGLLVGPRRHFQDFTYWLKDEMIIHKSANYLIIEIIINCSSCQLYLASVLNEKPLLSRLCVILRSWSTESRMRWPVWRLRWSGSTRTTTRFTSKSTILGTQRRSPSTSEERNWPRSFNCLSVCLCPFLLDFYDLKHWLY